MTTPTLPPPTPGDVASPRLPPPDAPTLPAPAATPAPVPPIAPTPSPTPTLYDDLAPSPRRRWPVVLALLAVAALGLGAWWLLGSDSSEPDATPTGDAAAELSTPRLDETDPFSPNDAGGSDASSGGSIGQVGADAISTAEELVDDLGPTEDETDLLAELGLGADGEPIRSPQDAPGHRFSWAFADGTTAAVVVDAATGDHEYVSNGGITYRQLGDEAFARSSADDDWTPIDPAVLADVERLGLADPLTVDDLLGGDVAPFASVRADGSWRFEADALGAADPDARAAWLAGVGLDPIVAGPIDLALVLHADGETIESARIVRSATGETVTYSLDEVLDVAPVIERPAG